MQSVIINKKLNQKERNKVLKDLGAKNKGEDVKKDTVRYRQKDP